MVNRYAKIEKFDEDGDLSVSYLEPLTTENLKIAVESELIEDGEVGQRLVLSVVEMTDEQYREVAEREGY